jgi:uncharacterized protein (DUF486 family)
MWTIILLILSNVFMTIAWYGHLRWPTAPLLLTIVLSWLIALPEYTLQVPANRIGQVTYKFKPSQLKVIQEVISLTVFVLFAWLFLNETPNWRTLAAFVLIGVAVWLVVFPGAAQEEAHGRAPPPAKTTG